MLSKSNSIIPNNYRELPEYVKNLSRFVLWRRYKPAGEDDFKKLPVDARTGEPAFKKGKPRHSYYVNFEQALSSFESTGDKYVGLGLDLYPGLEIGVDFDGCVEKRDGELVIDPEVQAKLGDLNSYAEFSPSCFFDDEPRGGIKVFLLGEAPQEDDPATAPVGKRYRNVNNAANHVGVEIHARERYFTLTAKPVPGSPQEVRNLSRAEVEHLYHWAENWRRQTENWTPSSSGVFPPLRGQKRDDVLAGKWHAFYPSSSEALRQIVNTLLIEKGGDIQKAEQDFFQTGFYKDAPRGNGKPWSEDWPRLRNSELAQSQTNACRYFENLYKQTSRKKQPEQTLEMRLERADQIDRRPLEFLWRPYLPKTGLVHFGGMSREGKSPVLVDLSARITSGKPWPDGSKNDLGGRSCLLLSAEDDWPTVVLPRFDLAGGDSKRLFRARMTRVKDQENPSEAMIALDRDFSELIKTVQKIPDLALIGIDPISNYLGSKEMNKDEEVRSVLMELVSLAEQRGFVVATIGHLNRREKGTHPLFRMMGAGAFHSVPRFVYAFGADRDSTSEFSHVMAQARGTLHAPSLRYRTELEGDVVRVIWDGTTTANAEDVVDHGANNEKSKEAEAAALLKEFLKAGKKPAKECKELLEASGFTDLNMYRIRKRAGVETTVHGGRHATWYLPTQFTQGDFGL